jgi:hypothetical protein
LKQPAAGDEFLLDAVRFKPSTSELETSSETALKKFVRLVKANPHLEFEIQVLLNGYEQDSIRSSPDLTEVLIDSIRTQVDDIDSLGQLQKRDSILIRTSYHNNRTQAQANSIVAYLVRSGVSEKSLRILTNAIPAPLPENRKLLIKAVAYGK